MVSPSRLEQRGNPILPPFMIADRGKSTGSRCSPERTTKDSMIGLIGPPDSIERCLRAARSLGVEDQLVPREYHELDEVPDLTAELDLACPVVLFTGTVPYTATRGLREWKGHHEYIAYTAGDLYHALIQILVDTNGEAPPLSVDKVGIPDVEAMFDDIPFPAPVFVEAPTDDQIDVDAIAASHLANLESGRASAAVTCLSAVHERLSASGAPSRRIQHSMPTLKTAISRAILLSQVSVTESTQVAVGAIVLGDELDEQTRSQSRTILSSFAEKLRGSFVPASNDRYFVYTTRGALEDAADRASLGQTSPFDELSALKGKVRVSFGIGSSVAAAEELALRGIPYAASSGHPLIYGNDGSISMIGLESSGVTPDRALPQIGIGPLSFRRLSRALHQLDVSRVTANDLANAYGVTARSARRILRRLNSIGVAIDVDETSGGMRGRPKTIYRIDLDRLLELSRPNSAGDSSKA